ncbi:uncharacterized protein LOC117221234 [Megalopta genalis]|uniref:uncharacterized protein LOC117221234 n=1 Tax=Megalopta genalis TaxID=115081 RepID=UPI003FD3C72C
MKFLLLLAFVAVAAAMRTFESEEAEKKFIASHFQRFFNISTEKAQECVVISGVTLANLRYWEDNLDSEENEITDRESMKKACCALVCCAQKRGLMIGTEIQMQEVFESIAILPVEVNNILHDVTVVCEQQVREQKDECLVGCNFFKCVMDRSHPLFQQL